VLGVSLSVRTACSFFDASYLHTVIHVKHSVERQSAGALPPTAFLQDPVTGLPEHRKAKLLDVFRVIDKVWERHLCGIICF